MIKHIKAWVGLHYVMVISGHNHFPFGRVQPKTKMLMRCFHEKKCQHIKVTYLTHKLYLGIDTKEL